MKKIISLLLVLLLISCTVASCAENEVEESIEASSEGSAEASKPWYSTSVPDDYSNIIIDPSSDAEVSTPEVSTPDVSVPDVSGPDVSVPDASTPDESVPSGGTVGYDGLKVFELYDFERSAIGYNVVYTKTSALQAKSCVTHFDIGITAIYDGSVTRFFDAVNGTYYAAVSGKYLYPCCENSFISGDLNDVNWKYSVSFNRPNENEATIVMNGHTGECGGHYEFVYSATDKRVYAYDSSLYGIKGITPCRYYDGSVMSCFDGADVDIIEAELGKYGLASNERVIVPFEYDLIATEQNSAESVGVFLAIKDGRCYYFSSEGRNLTPDGFDCGSQPFGDRAWVFDGSQGYIIKFN